MNRRHFLSLAASAGALPAVTAAEPAPAAQEVYPGVWRFRFGTPEKITPAATRSYPPGEGGLKKLPRVARCPVAVEGKATPRGYLLELPLEPYELVYGLGLQLQSFLQRGRKKKLRVNADPAMDTGDTHAPVPFYVTTRGYGVFVDTARYATFYCGNKRRKDDPHAPAPPSDSPLPESLRRYAVNESSRVLVEIPEARGVDVYVFGGPEMREAVQRYNLFSGGGPLPPRWGLGVWYRAKLDYTQDEVLRLAGEFRDRRIPCDVIGLEPGWQTHAYSCTFVWSKKFPEPAEMIRKLGSDGFRVNLWEHAFTHPDSPIYRDLLPLSGDYEVWGGVAPDFLLPEARRVFAGYHEKVLADIGVAGFKLDECDNSDFTGNWSFPEISRFPSGADGEQMHSLFGLRYQDAIESVYAKRKQRTYGLARSSGALAAPYPYALYSDLYNHREFIRALVNSGFSGLLWTPELRDARDTEDLVRRLQSVVLSPLAMINAWYIRNPPWKQVERAANNAGKLTPDWERVEALCRSALELRMKLVPYLHAAFVRYRREGVPPFRALVLDYPRDRQTWLVDDQYMMGGSLLVAPAFAGQPRRDVYLPEGEWFDFRTGTRHSGGRKITVEPALDEIPLFVKSGTLLPLAEAAAHTGDPRSWRLSVRAYGGRPAPAVLYEDDGSWDPALAEVTLAWDPEKKSGSLRREGPGKYEAVEWTAVG